MFEKKKAKLVYKIDELKWKSTVKSLGKWRKSESLSGTKQTHVGHGNWAQGPVWYHQYEYEKKPLLLHYPNNLEDIDSQTF